MNDNYNDEHWKIYKVFLHLLQKNRRYKNKVIKYKELTDKIGEQYDILYCLEKAKKYKFDECSKTMGKVLYEIVLFYLGKRADTEYKESIIP